MVQNYFPILYYVIQAQIIYRILVEELEDYSENKPSLSGDFLLYRS